MSENKCPYCKKQIEHPVTEKICSIKYDVKKRKKYAATTEMTFCSKQCATHYQLGCEG